MNEHLNNIIVAKKELPSSLVKLGWVLTMLGLVLVGISYITDAQRAVQNNLIGFTFLASVSVGAVFFIALEYIAGAVWSTPFRRVTEFLAATLPLLIILAIPLFMNMHNLFEWTHTDVVTSDKVLHGKASYLNVNSFTIRFAVMMAIWMLFYLVFRKHSFVQDLNHDQKHTSINIKFAAVFIPVYAISISLFAFDWLMSLTPHWFSTIFGVYYFIGSIVCTLSVITYLVVSLAEKGYFFKGITEDHYYSFGALLFALLSFWAYIAFSQFMLIWYANLPEENFWFIARWKNGWEYISSALALFHFWIPYFMLVSRPSKMNKGNLKRTALLLIAAHFLDLYWMVMPTFHASPVFSFHELAFPMLTLGLIIVVFAIQSKKYNMVPIGDPKLERGIDFRL
ncbi:MAG: quinol:cytochrome C oxidoreductase [Bacteroidota bacterium]|nr:quinol:cytochrome C oxidoreductase [Bacteroidota bacterium]